MKLNHVYGHKTRIDALRHAKAEKRRHKLGRDWKIYVHENMGWFWSFDNGVNVHVSPFAWNGKISSYTCFLGDNHSGVYCERGRTPQTCVRNTFKVAKPHVAFHQRLLEEAQRVVKSS